MATVWRLGEAKVEDVRAAQPERERSAYNTVQTVMNRLVERRLLERSKRGKAYVYRPTQDEGTFLSRMIGERLADASPEGRRAALVSLLDGLDAAELDDLSRYARRIRRARRRKAT
jgi:predicted transcriptional regulator